MARVSLLDDLNDVELDELAEVTVKEGAIKPRTDVLSALNSPSTLRPSRPMPAAICPNPVEEPLQVSLTPSFLPAITMNSSAFEELLKSHQKSLLQLVETHQASATAHQNMMRTAQEGFSASVVTISTNMAASVDRIASAITSQTVAATEMQKSNQELILKLIEQLGRDRR